MRLRFSTNGAANAPDELERAIRGSMYAAAEPLSSEITAALGPTNTGKTHRCITRLLEHESGMIGLPLRLLAREVYDRLTTQVGQQRVALITGEERRVPQRPDYWVCTVEAMPISVEVDFLAVDEVQLMSHPRRGHVFTERVLHARGRRETWFLGAETARPLIHQLAPSARPQQLYRLSKLRHTGPTPLGKLPPRSAVVAFSATQVYELAERLRVRKGGAAVVLGALSPRTRNAQVAMYQAGDVDYLVATDAIGMGLNMAIQHVAFASLGKFDGRQSRPLSRAELAQVAGRAGRYLQDGSFGTLSPGLRLDEATARAIEQHAFPAQTKALWRNAELCFDSLEALFASLGEGPRRACLQRIEDADDATALRLVSRPSERQQRLKDPEQLRLLWDVCQLPDYRKLLPELHAELIWMIFERLQAGRVDDDWLQQRVLPLDDPSGDLDTLMARIAAIRTWTYVSNHPRWVEHPQHWRERTCAIEDRLSDALHERLMQRFVERRKTSRQLTRPNRPATDAARSSPGGGPKPHSSRVSDAPGADHPFAVLAQWHAKLHPPPNPTTTEEQWLERMDGAQNDAFDVTPEGYVVFDGQRLARLSKGSKLTLPEVRLEPLPISGGQRMRLHRRLIAYCRDFTHALLQPLRPDDADSGQVRGLLYHLAQNLGTSTVGELQTLLDSLEDNERERLERRSIVIGRHHVYCQRLLSGPALQARYALTLAYYGDAATPGPAHQGRPSLARQRGHQARAARCTGFMLLGPRVCRCDLVERASSALTLGSEPDLRQLAAWFGCRGAMLDDVLGRLARSAPRSAISCRSQRNIKDGRKVTRKKTRRGTRQRVASKGNG